MPQRTNEFQTLFYHVKSHLEGDRGTVTESAMVRNQVTGKDEEIDVLVERDGDHPIRIGFQCRDHKRKAGPDWIRNLVQQRADCKIDLMIAIHSSGFTDGAIRTAEQHNIRYMTLKRANDLSWDSKMFRGLKLKMVPMLFKASVTLNGHLTELSIDDLHAKIVTIDSHNTPISVQQLSSDFLKESGKGNEMKMQVESGKEWVTNIYDYCPKNSLIQIDGSVEPVNHFIFDVRAANSEFPVKWSPYVLDGDGSVKDVVELVYWKHGYELRMLCEGSFPWKSMMVYGRDVNYRDFSYQRVQW